jgi:hypothetical protein
LCRRNACGKVIQRPAWREFHHDFAAVVRAFRESELGEDAVDVLFDGALGND